MFSLYHLDDLAKEASKGIARLNSGILRALGKRVALASNAGFDRFLLLSEADKEADALYMAILRELDRSTATAGEVYTQAARLAYEAANKYYAAKGLTQVPVEQQRAIVNFVNATANNTKNTFMNLSNTSAIGFRVMDLDGTVKYEGFKTHYHNLVDQAIAEVGTGQTSYNSAVRNALKQTADSGIRVVDYQSGYSRRLDSAMRQNVLDGVRDIAHEVSRRTGEEFGADGVEIDAHNYCAMDHLPFQGRQFSKAEFNQIQEDLPREFGQWNCVLGDTVLITPKIKAAFRREYAGEIVIISTASGKQLSVTPNHPILTENGWVTAGLLREGDNVISSTFSGKISNPCPNIHNSETTIQEVFEALTVIGKQIRIPTSACDFHGEIPDKEVDIVLPDSLLNYGSSTFFNEEIVEHLLGNAIHVSGSLFANSTSKQTFLSPFHTTNFIMSWLSKLGSSLRGHSIKAVFHRVRSIICDWKTKLLKCLANSAFRKAANFFGNFIFPHSTLIHTDNIVRGISGVSGKLISPALRCINSTSEETILDRVKAATVHISEPLHSPTLLKQLDNVIFIEKKRFVGHVYNLHTESEWYSANGIITHNCRHTYYPIIMGLSEPLYTEDERQAMKEQSTEKIEFEGKQYTRYEATQLQRRIETSVRQSKDRAIIAKAAEDDISRRIEQLRINQLRDKYALLSKKFSLPDSFDRMSVAGFRPVKAK